MKIHSQLKSDDLDVPSFFETSIWIELNPQQNGWLNAPESAIDALDAFVCSPKAESNWPPVASLMVTGSFRGPKSRKVQKHKHHDDPLILTHSYENN